MNQLVKSFLKLKAIGANLWPLVTKEELLGIKQLLDKQMAQCLREVRIEQDKELKSKISEQLEALRTATSVVEFGINSYQAEESLCLYTTTIKWLFEAYAKTNNQLDMDEISAAVTIIFSEFLTNKPQSALHYYSQNQLEIDKLGPLVGLHVKLQTASQKLALQSTHAAGIIPLLSIYFDEPYLFSTLLLWLLNNKVSPNQIVNSNLLHYFIAYHLCYIDSEDSVIKQVFHLLSQLKDNKNARELIELAQQTSCAQRGFDTTSLTGERRKELIKINSVAPKLALNLTEENLKNLFDYFGVSFLEKTIELLSRESNSKLKGLLQKLFNQPEKEVFQLPQLMHFITKHEEAKKMRLLQTLADLINDSTAKELLAKNTIVLHLIPYKPSLIKAMTVEDLKQHIHQITENDHTPFEQLSQLMLLCKLLYGKNASLVTPLLEKIIDVSLAHEEVALNDASFISELKRYRLPTDYITSKFVAFNQDLADFIALRTTEPLTREAYYAIEDFWHSQINKVKFLKRLDSQETSFPFDKYALKIIVVNSCSQQHAAQFDLLATLESMATQYDNEELYNSEKERTLIEVLLASDNNSIQSQIIDHLEKGLKIQRWTTKIYGTMNVLNGAINRQNLSLLNRLINLPDDYHCRPDEAILRPAFERALSKNKLTFFQLINCLASTDNQLNQNLILKFLPRVLAEFSSIIPLILNGKLNSKVVLEILNIAYKKHHLEAIKFICSLTGDNKPTSVEITKLLILAARERRYSVVKLLCELTDGNKPSAEGIAKALIKMANKGELEIVKKSVI